MRENNKELLKVEFILVSVNPSGLKKEGSNNYYHYNYELNGKWTVFM